MSKIKKFAECVIRSYNFSTNCNTGFSCNIPDLNQLNRNCFILWVYSKRHNRFETHFQNLFSTNRLNVISQYNIGKADYSNAIYQSVVKFISELNNIKGFDKIGKGIKNTPVNRSKIYNLAISFDFIKQDYRILKEIEIVFTNNSLIDYINSLKGNTNIPLKRSTTLCYDKIFTL